MLSLLHLHRDRKPPPKTLGSSLAHLLPLHTILVSRPTDNALPQLRKIQEIRGYEML